ncbi:MAG: hypothetical protein Q4B48_05505, partial [Syntrophomonadaceae bacterium]|nr:hypothetical protein [Syntrophomonadaceae bacterium]
DLIDAAIAQELGRMAELLAEAVRQGKEAALLLRESSLYMRDLLLYSAVGETAGLTMVAEQNRGRLKAQAQKLRRGDLLKALQLMMDSGEKIRFNESQRFLMEYCFFELAHLLNPAAPAEAAVSASGRERGAQPEQAERTADVASIAPAPREKLSKKDAREAVWQQLLALVKKKRLPTHALLSPAKLIGSKGDVIVIAYKQSYRMHRERMELEENLTPLKETLQEMFKKNMEVEFILLNEEENNNLLVKEAIEQFGEDVVNIKD